MYCPKCGKEISDLAVVCVNCGTKVNTPAKAEDKPSFMLNLISFFIPLVGFICWAVMGSTTPKKGKSCGITALVSTILGILFLIAYYVFIIIISLKQVNF